MRDLLIDTAKNALFAFCICVALRPGGPSGSKPSVHACASVCLVDHRGFHIEHNWIERDKCWCVDRQLHLFLPGRAP